VTSQSSAGYNKEPDITAAPGFQPPQQTPRVAVRPPDHCVQQGAGQVDGRGNLDQLTLNTSCGVWLAELERALIEKGYNVVSWQSVMGMHGGQEFERAAALGVELVILVNSLSTDEIQGDASASKTVTFFRSNPRKDRLAEWPAPPVYRDSMLEHIRTDADFENQLAATLDITVVQAGTQKSIWFYRHSLSNSVASAAENDWLFVCSNGRCVVRAARQPDQVRSPSANSSTVTLSAQQVSAPTDLRQNERFELSRNIVRYFVGIFDGYMKNVMSRQPQQAVPPPIPGTSGTLPQ
jgi:hypothetical protein